MEEEIYDSHYYIEDKHWWFKGRRSITRAVLKCFIKSKLHHVVEVGCGSGGNLLMLSEFGPVTGIEMHKRSRERAQARGIGNILEGYLPSHMPPLPRQMLITAFDVLEHVEDDQQAFNILYQMLDDGGVLLVTVPAFPWMWTEHDVLHHHYRRYTRKQLKDRLENAGFAVLKLSYYNTLLSPLIISIRLLASIFRGSLVLTEKPPPRMINELFAWIFSAERHALAKGVNFPFGTSLLVVAKRL